MKVLRDFCFSKLSVTARSLVFSLSGVLFLFFLLECWRFPFFLTDDNLTAGYPILVRIFRQASSGGGLFLDPYLSGGSDFSHSIERIYHFNPIPRILMRLLSTREYLIIDACVLVYLLISTFWQTLFLSRISKLAGAEPKAGRLCFLALASLTSIYHLTVFSAWGSWAAAAGALSWIGYGVLSSERKKGIPLVFTGTLYLILIGDLHPFFYGMLFMGMFAVVSCWCFSSPRPAIIFTAGILPAAVCLFLLMAPAFQGFESSERAGGLSLMDQSMMSVPLPYLLISSFWGAWSALFFPVKPEYFYLALPYAAGIAYSASAWLAIPVFFKKGPKLFHFFVLLVAVGTSAFVLPGIAVALLIAWTTFLAVLVAINFRNFHFNRWEWSLFGLFLLASLFIGRPHWLAWIVSHLPIYSSLRWPLRELMLFHFFGAAFLACSAMKLKGRVFWFWSSIGILLMVSSTIFHSAPSINSMDVDRNLILDGTAARFWEAQKKLLPENTMIAAVVERDDVLERPREIPYSLIGAFDYPSLFQVFSHYGYAVRGGYGSEPSHLKGRPLPFDHSGAIFRSDVPALLALFPNTTLVSVASLKPLRIRFETKDKKWDVDVKDYTAKSGALRESVSNSD